MTHVGDFDDALAAVVREGLQAPPSKRRRPYAAVVDRCVALTAAELLVEFAEQVHAESWPDAIALAVELGRRIERGQV